MKRTLQLTSLAASLILALAGCASNQQTAENEDPAKCAAPKPGVVTSVNSMCAVAHNDPVDPSVATAEWKGQKVGFCCQGCVPKWNRMSAEQKDANLAAAMAAK